jgi:hypothetical protein
MSTILRRKSIVQTCRAVIKYMEVDDGREEIDSLLDEAACCLANVSQKMHDYWVRAMKEREAEEARLAKREQAMSRAKPRRITPGIGRAKATLTKMLKADPALRELIKERMLQEESNGTRMDGEDEEKTEGPGPTHEIGHGRERAHL